MPHSPFLAAFTAGTRFAQHAGAGRPPAVPSDTSALAHHRDPRRPGAARLTLSNGAPVDVQWHGHERRCRWQKPPPGVHLIVEFTTGVAPLAPS